MRRKLIGMVLILGAFPLVMGCARMRAARRAERCNFDGAYKAGFNDAHRGRPMDERFSQICYPQQQPQVEQAYRDGYMERMERGPAVVVIGQGGVGTAAVVAHPYAAPPYAAQGGGPGPSWHCEKSYGQEACGYQCIKAYGQIQCSQHPAHNCVRKYSNIRCGLNCRPHFAEIVCDE